MKIHNDSPIRKPHAQFAGSAAPNTQPQKGASVDASGVSTRSTVSLVDQVAASTEVREDVVANVKARLAEGEFASQQAAYKTAEAILNS